MFISLSPLRDAENRVLRGGGKKNIKQCVSGALRPVFRGVSPLWRALVAGATLKHAATQIVQILEFTESAYMIVCLLVCPRRKIFFLTFLLFFFVSADNKYRLL